MATAKLGRSEVRVLRDFARGELLQIAECYFEGPTWRRPDEPSIADKRAAAHERRSVVEREPEAAAAEERERLTGAAEVYGILVSAQLGFEEVRGLPAPGEWVEIEFSEGASAWLETQRRELRSSLEARRGTVEMGWSSVKRECFVLFVLDGIFQHRVVVTDGETDSVMSLSERSGAAC